MEENFNNNYLTKINLPYVIYEFNGKIFSLFKTSQYLINLLGINNYKELNDLNMSGFLHQADKESFQKAIEQVVKTKKPLSLKIHFYNLVKKEYFPFTVELSIYKWTNNSKQILLHFIALEKKGYLGNDSLINSIEKLELQEKNNRIKELQAIQKARNTFSARMSHDLRTPMNAIINFAQFGATETENIKDKEYFTEIEKASKYMLELLNDILNFDKIELKKLIINKQTINLLTNLNNIYSVLTQKAQEKNIKITTNINTINPNTYIITDALKEKQIFSNILSNAIKYTPQGGNITWTVEIETVSKNKLYQRHMIKDNGIGMSKEFQKKMFLPFIRENDNSFLAEESSGLGLAIVKSIVTALKGEISCKSKLGEGTTFTIKLPCKIASEKDIEAYKKAKIERKHLPIHNLKKESLNLLICEDNLINQKVLKMILEKEGYKVTLANNGQEGLELAKKNEYALIIMDIKMPILNGLEAAKAIRLFDKKIPIIALSANVFETDIKKSKEAGMNVHLAKPIDRHTLLLTIDSLTKLI